VIVLWDLSEEEDWRRLGVERFAAGYALEDAVYEQIELEWAGGNACPTLIYGVVEDDLVHFD
jgi:hypothetical protein